MVELEDQAATASLQCATKDEEKQRLSRRIEELTVLAAASGKTIADGGGSQTEAMLARLQMAIDTMASAQQQAMTAAATTRSEHPQPQPQPQQRSHSGLLQTVKAGEHPSGRAAAAGPAAESDHVSSPASPFTALTSSSSAESPSDDDLLGVSGASTPVGVGTHHRAYAQRHPQGSSSLRSQPIVLFE